MGCFDVERLYVGAKKRLVVRQDSLGSERAEALQIKMTNDETGVSLAILIQSIDLDSVVGIRDRTVIKILIYTGAHIGAISNLRRRDSYNFGDQFCLTFNKKEAKSRQIPVWHDLQWSINDYLNTAQFNYFEASGPLFRETIRRKTR